MAAAALAPTARADFPYLPRIGANPHDPRTFKLPPGTVPNEFARGVDWKFAATPERSVQSNLLINSRGDELCGVRGASIVDSLTVQPAGCLAGRSVRTAWQVTTGRPDVLIAVLGARTSSRRRSDRSTRRCSRAKRSITRTPTESR
jgi:hypothetical protein